MYTVYVDNWLLYDSRLPDYAMIDPVLSLKANEPGQLTFVLPKTNPNINELTRLKSRVKVYRDNILIFLGRLIEDKVGIKNTTNYVVEGALAFLLDSVQRPFTFDGTPAELFAFLLQRHNEQVNIEQQIGIGNCNVTTADSIVVTTEEYLSTWAVMKQYVIDPLNGYLVFSYDSNDNPTLNYLSDAPATATQRIEFGENLRDLAVSYNADETYTACIPLGAKLSEIDENVDSDERLTIADANGGVDYLIDSETAAVYGVIFAPVSLTTFETEKNATYLMQIGLSWLANQGVRLKRSITLTAVDLHNLDNEVNAFSFLDKVVVSCGDICPEETFVLSSMDIPLNNPGSTIITLGDTRPSLIGDGINKETENADRIESIEADYVTNQAVSSIVSEQISTNTSILQSAEQIIMTALGDFVKTSDFESFQSTVQTTLSIMTGTIEANFSETTSDISELNGSVSHQFETINSFIRLISSGIVLGESSSNIKLKLENDILYFFTGEEDQVSTENALAYFSAGKLYVNDVQILTSMRIGPFAWVPESDNLNFKLSEV